MSRKKLYIFFAILVGTVFILTACEKETISTTLHLDYLTYDTAQDLVDAADLMFVGTVKEVTYEMLDVRLNKNVGEGELFPYTLYKIELSEVYKGNISEDSIILKCMGGKFSNMEYVVEDAPNILEGETYLFLAETYINTYPSLLNISQACYDINSAEAVSEEENGEIQLSQILDLLKTE